MYLNLLLGLIFLAQCVHSSLSAPIPFDNTQYSLMKLSRKAISGKISQGLNDIFSLTLANIDYDVSLISDYQTNQLVDQTIGELVTQLAKEYYNVLEMRREWLNGLKGFLERGNFQEEDVPQFIKQLVSEAKEKGIPKQSIKFQELFYERLNKIFLMDYQIYSIELNSLFNIIPFYGYTSLLKPFVNEPLLQPILLQFEGQNNNLFRNHLQSAIFTVAVRQAKLNIIDAFVYTIPSEFVINCIVSDGEASMLTYLMAKNVQGDLAKKKIIELVVKQCIATNNVDFYSNLNVGLFGNVSEAIKIALKAKFVSGAIAFIKKNVVTVDADILFPLLETIHKGKDLGISSADSLLNKIDFEDDSLRWRVVKTIREGRFYNVVQLMEESKDKNIQKIAFQAIRNIVVRENEETLDYMLSKIPKRWEKLDQFAVWVASPLKYLVKFSTTRLKYFQLIPHQNVSLVIDIVVSFIRHRLVEKVTEYMGRWLIPAVCDELIDIAEVLIEDNTNGENSADLYAIMFIMGGCSPSLRDQLALCLQDHSDKKNSQK